MSRQGVYFTLQRWIARGGFMAYRLAHRLGIGVHVYQAILQSLTWLVGRAWLLRLFAPHYVERINHFAADLNLSRQAVLKAHVACGLWYRLFGLVLISGSKQEIVPLLRITGRENLERARQHGMGVILAMPHMWGTLHPFVLRWSQLLDTPIGVLLGNVTRESQRHERLSATESDSPQKRATARGRELLEGYAALRAGKIVIVLPDGRKSPQFELAVVCGRIHEVRPGFAQLAILSGAPVAPAYTVLSPDGMLHIHFGPAFQDMPAAPEAERVTCLVNQFVAFQAQTWRAYPGCVPASRMTAHLRRPRAESYIATTVQDANLGA